MTRHFDLSESLGRGMLFISCWLSYLFVLLSSLTFFIYISIDLTNISFFLTNQCMLG